MSPGVRKAVLALHLTCSVGWIGTVVAYLALGITAVRTQDVGTIRAAWIAMEVTGWFAIVPLAILSLVTGLVMAVGTKWGLLRHWWVVFSLVLTVFAVTILLLHMPTVSALADQARTAKPEDLAALGGDLGHPSVGLVILLSIQLLNLYKPRGLTRHGLRLRNISAG